VSENQLYDFICVLVALISGAFFVALVGGLMRRVQPRLNMTKPIIAAFVIRVIAALAVSSSSAATQLRGGDELTWLQNARSLANWDLISTGMLTNLTHELQVFFFALDYRVLDRVPDMMFRIQVIAIAVTGIALLAGAVYELAGARAARITAWVLAIEPANVFFSGIIHKEPFMMLAEGLVAFGGAILWTRGKFIALVPMVLGCLIATATRSYVGWFLAVAAALVVLHAAMRWKKPMASAILVTIVVALGIIFVPVVWQASSKAHLKGLQSSQDWNSSDKTANLSLERVDYSSRGKIIVNLPTRVVDILTRPYPWQVGNTSQQLGLVGTSFMFLGLLLLISTLINNGGNLMSRAGPLIYPAILLLIAYALSAGNAGTAFRYRTHLVAFLLAVLCVLRETRAEEARAPAAQPAGHLKPILRRSQTT
jgi:hypothetical protein